MGFELKSIWPKANSRAHLECAAVLRIQRHSHAWRRFRSVVLALENSIAVRGEPPVSSRLLARSFILRELLRSSLRHPTKAPPRMRMSLNA